MPNQPQINPPKEKRPQKTSLLAILILVAVLLGAIIVAGYFYFVPADRENKNASQAAENSNINVNLNNNENQNNNSNNSASANEVKTAIGLVSLSCATKSDCVLIGKEKDYDCCGIGSCLDYSQGIWVAVNNRSFQEIIERHNCNIACPDNMEVCFYNDYYEVGCQNNRCQTIKVTKTTENSDSNEISVIGGQVSLSCSSKQDCRLIDKEKDYTVCCSQYSQPDYTKGIWVAVNSSSFQKIVGSNSACKLKVCPDNMEVYYSGNVPYEVACQNNRCQTIKINRTIVEY
ncbi:MAG: hypothetical protein WC528_01660 [Patescibacteria group bacterium]